MALTYYPEEAEQDWPDWGQAWTQEWVDSPYQAGNDAWGDAEPYRESFGGRPAGGRVDVMALAAVALLLFLGLQLMIDRGRPAPAAPDTAQPAERAAPEQAVPAPESLAPAPAVASPYETYNLTQGPHGASYGHMAIDIAAGEGATVRSPINGTVTALYVDVWGNTVIVIENPWYQVTMLHGDYTVAVGQPVHQGDSVGTESNNGYTTDMQGNSCRNRNCGYHTHLNVFDKTLGGNVNPLDILDKPQTQ